MGRANLGQLLGNVGENAAPTAPKPELQQESKPGPKSATKDNPSTPPSTASKAERPPSRVALPTAKQTAKPSAGPVTPTYLRYVRKETRLREDQQNQLTLQSRRLNRAKTTQGERITENSLIRVAVDLFLARIDRAFGDDEDAIRTSMTP